MKLPVGPRLAGTLAAALGVVLGVSLTGPPVAAVPEPRGGDPLEPGAPTTAWREGALRVDTAALLSRSDVALRVAPWRADQAMPLGNGTLGAAVWAADGFTAQLNRGDTFPDLRSAGHLRLPDLMALSSAPDYSGRLDLHDATLVQEGAGTIVRTWVRADKDQLVVDVSGANPDREQTVELALWKGRTPVTEAHGAVASLAESWVDDKNGAAFSQLTAVTADARDVRARVLDERTVAVTFRPREDGSFRVLAGVPEWDGQHQRLRAEQATRVTPTVESAHLRWWHDFWDRATPMRLDSADGKARYYEALRAQQLYMSAASMRGDEPASHGGVTSLFSPYRDDIHWSPDSWWHFNLRQPVWVNRGAGVAELNEAYLDLYLDRIEEMRAWTRRAWPEADGICVPEFLRYDGSSEAACSSSKGPDWLNRILSTGPEVLQNIWQQYLHTGERRLLERGYPLMVGVVEFYLSLLEEGEDGLLHLHGVNSLEVQWDTTDPTPDVAAMRTMFPIVADLASKRGDADLAQRLREAARRLPELPTTIRNGVEVIAWSATDEPGRNTQNPDLEAVWPWRVVGADSQLAQDTFTHRAYLQTREWASDAQWAAWLRRPADMVSLLARGTDDFQAFSNGFSAHNRRHDPLRGGGFYDGWNAVVASTLQDALVQEHDGVVTVAPAWPEAWRGVGAVEVPGGHRVSVEVASGEPTLVGVQAGRTDDLVIASPWSGAEVEVVDEQGRVVSSTSGDQVTARVVAGRSYVLQRVDRPLSSYAFDRLGGEQATDVQRHGTRVYGVESSTPQVVSDSVRVVAPYKLRQMVRTEVGAPVYVDRSYVVSSVPPEMAGTLMVRGANDDGKVVSDDYLTLELAKPTTVYVAFDGRGEGTWWPKWLVSGGWTRTGDVVGTTDRPLVVFRKEVDAGTLVLGGNSGVAGQGSSAYVTFVRE
jgi:hypothetical protein